MLAQSQQYINKLLGQKHMLKVPQLCLVPVLLQVVMARDPLPQSSTLDGMKTILRWIQTSAEARDLMFM